MKITNAINNFLYPGNRARLTILDKNGQPREISPKEAKKLLDEIHKANLDSQIAGPHKSEKGFLGFLKSIIRKIF